MKTPLNALLYIFSLMLFLTPNTFAESRNQPPIIEAKVRPSMLARHWMHHRDQKKRSQAIIGHFLGIVGKTYQNDEFNCKTGVRDEFLKLTGGLIVVPSTWPDENGFSWTPSPQFHEVQNPSLEKIQPGDILQMRYYSSKTEFIPHTAIVKSNKGGSICLLDNARKTNPDGSREPYQWDKRCYEDWRFTRRVTSGKTKKPEYSIYRVLSGKNSKT